jgi:hypothetical protein
MFVQGSDSGRNTLRQLSRDLTLALAAMLLLFGSGQAEAAGSPGSGKVSHKPYVIYGNDDRLDVFEETDAARRELARSVVALVPANSLKPAGMGYRLQAGTLQQEAGVCSSEKFADQIIPAFCSGVLVAPNVIATAGHCVQEPNFCSSAKFVFGFNIDSRGKDPALVDADQVVSCKKVIHSEVNGMGADFALVEIDRQVTNRPALPLSQRQHQVGEGVFVIGHPVGLPAKIAGGAEVRRQTGDYFIANLDTFGGNSGSAVFDAKTNSIAGLLVRGERDFTSRGGCQVSFRCRIDGCRGEDVSNADSIATKLREFQSAQP